MADCPACAHKEDKCSPKIPNVIQINNPAEVTLFHKVMVPASMGDEEDFPPTAGKYRNTLLVYEINGHPYLYSSDGIPTSLVASAALYDEEGDHTDGAMTQKATTDSLGHKQDLLSVEQMEAVNSGANSTKIEQIAENAEDITEIQGMIPNAASDTNQLADKQYVDTSVQTALASFRGNWVTWSAVPSDENDYPEDSEGSKTPTKNDYMVVQDASGYPTSPEPALSGTWRFKYTGVWATDGKNGWAPEYKVNDTPFTAEQLAAINSGATDTLIGQITTNQGDISDLQSGKLNKTTTFWGQTETSGAVGGTLTLTESGQTATIATSGHNATDAGIKMGNSKNYVEAGVSTITLSSTTGNIQLKPKSGSSVDVMSSKITSLAAPTANTDAANKKYVDDGLATKQGTLTAGSGIDITSGTISADTSVLATKTDLSAKQDALVAGSNITISGATISAANTTYSVFTGATSAADGTTGLVKQPLKADRAKFLKGDGTWASPSNSTYTAGDGLKLTNGEFSVKLSEGSVKSYYVDCVNGDDTNDGSQNAPFKNLVKALSKLGSVGSAITVYFKSAGTYLWPSSYQKITGKFINLLPYSGVTGVIITLPSGELQLTNCTVLAKANSSSDTFTFATSSAGTERKINLFNSRLECTGATFDEVIVQAQGGSVELASSVIYAIQGEETVCELINCTITTAYYLQAPIYMMNGSTCTLGAMTATARTSSSPRPFVQVEKGSRLVLHGALTHSLTAQTGYAYGIYADASILQDKGSFASAYETIGSGIYTGNATLRINDDVELPYGSFTGASSGVAGATGLVPAPAAGDDNKYLRGDGSWQTVSQNVISSSDWSGLWT